LRARACAISREAALLVVCARVGGLGRQVTRPCVVKGSRYHHEPKCCILPAQAPVFILLYAPSLDFLSTAGTRVGLKALAPKLPSSPSRTLESENTQDRRAVFVHHLVACISVPLLWRVGPRRIAAGGWLTSIAGAGVYRMIVFGLLAMRVGASGLLCSVSRLLPRAVCVWLVVGGHGRRTRVWRAARRDLKFRQRA
jgi:hypothetical protein